MISQFLQPYNLLLHSKEGKRTIGRMGKQVVLYYALWKIYTELTS